MSWKQTRQEIKSISRSIFGANANLCIGASAIFFTLAAIIPFIISSKFMPKADATALFDAYASGAGSEEMLRIYLDILQALFTPRNIALIVCIILLGILIASPAIVGAAAFFVDMTEGRPLKTTSVLRFYTKSALALRAFSLVVLVSVICLACFLILNTLSYLAFFLILGAGASQGLALLTSCLIDLICIALCLLISLRFILSVFVMGALRCGVGQALSTALRITRRGASLELLLFVLSFFIWFLLCALTLGFGLIFIAPYPGLALAIFTKRLLFRHGMNPPPKTPL